jgi:hypothetical protein
MDVPLQIGVPKRGVTRHARTVVSLSKPFRARLCAVQQLDSSDPRKQTR